MTLSQVRSFYGLSCRATPTLPGTSGSVQIGPSNTSTDLGGGESPANVAYSMRAIFAAAADALVLDLTNNDTTGSTAWVAGTQQVETNTVVAASGITTSGNATITVTATGMTGSPKAISVALTTTAHTTATLIAAAIAAGLNADTDYAAMWVATSSGADVISKAKAVYTYTVGAETVNIWPADVANHNVSIANGTCAGITTAGTSTNTTPGVATDGVKIYDGDTFDFEGLDIPSITVLRAALFQSNSGSFTVAGAVNDVFTIPSTGAVLVSGGPDASSGLEDAYTFTASATSADISITVIGATV